MQLRNGKIINRDVPTQKPKNTVETKSPIIGYKKAYDDNLVILEIPVWAKHNMDRENVFDKQYAKHRCSEALVKEIINLRTGKNVETARSIQEYNFMYNVGETVRPRNGFCEILNEVCAGGIHFFLDRETAENYNGRHPSNGEVKTRHDNGRLYTQFTMVNGVGQGEYRMWHNNGMLAMYCFFSKGMRREGCYYTFFESGQPETLVEYKNGLTEGACRSWYGNGVLKSTGAYRKGTAVGVWQNWNEKGELVSETSY